MRRFCDLQQFRKLASTPYSSQRLHFIIGLMCKKKKKPYFVAPNIYFGEVLWFYHGFALDCQQITTVCIMNYGSKENTQG